MAQLNLARIHGTGCGSSMFNRKTKYRGSVTTLISPKVEVTPALATDQKSARISEN
jgi:hypothetical protein